MTPISQLAQHWPRLDMAKVALLKRVEQNPGSTIVDLAEDAGITEGAARFHLHTLGGGQGTRYQAGLGLVRVETPDDDKRCRALFLTKAGTEALKLLAPLFTPGVTATTPPSQGAE